MFNFPEVIRRQVYKNTLLLWADISLQYDTASATSSLATIISYNGTIYRDDNSSVIYFPRSGFYLFMYKNKVGSNMIFNFWYPSYSTPYQVYPNSLDFFVFFVPPQTRLDWEVVDNTVDSMSDVIIMYLST